MTYQRVDMVVRRKLFVFLSSFYSMMKTTFCVKQPFGDSVDVGLFPSFYKSLLLLLLLVLCCVVAVVLLLCWS